MMQINFVDPWEPVGSKRELFERELRSELSSDNSLAHFAFRAIGRRVDCDNVLFEVCDENSSFKLALIHLTWSSKSEPSPWPLTKLFVSTEEFVTNQMIPDAQDYNS